MIMSGNTKPMKYRYEMKDTFTNSLYKFVLDAKSVHHIFSNICHRTNILYCDSVSFLYLSQIRIEIRSIVKKMQALYMNCKFVN